MNELVRARSWRHAGGDIVVPLAASKPVAILFDIDGTLIDSSGAGGGALLHALREEFRLADPIPVRLHGRTDLGIMTELLQANQIEATEGHLRRLRERYFEVLPDELARRDGRVLPGVREILEAIIDRPDRHLGILTGNMPRSAQFKLEHFDLWHYFEFGIFGDQAMHRPLLRGPAIRTLAERMVGDRRTAKIIVIGDTPLDIELAHAMEASCLAVCTGGFTNAELHEAGAQRVVADLSDTEDLLAWIFNTIEVL